VTQAVDSAVEDLHIRLKTQRYHKRGFSLLSCEIAINLDREFPEFLRPRFRCSSSENFLAKGLKPPSLLFDGGRY
jgi:hypothetical protein